MKKLLGIVVLGFLWCNVVFASCAFKDEEGEWKYYSSLGKKYAKVWGVVLSGEDKGYGHFVAGEGKSTNDALDFFYSKECCQKGFCKVTYIGDTKINDNYQLQIAKKYYGSAILSQYFSGYKKQEDTASISNSTQDQQYESTPKFASVKKDKFYYKYKNKYMRMPESVLCISYINAYGWHKREKKQTIKYEVLETRGIICDPYIDAAYYDNKKRRKEVADSLVEVLDSGLDAAYGVNTSDNKNTKRTQRNCIVQKVGKNLYKQTCR